MDFKVVAKPVVKVEKKKDEYQELVDTLIAIKDGEVVQLKFQNYKAVYDRRATITQKIRKILKSKGYKIYTSITQVGSQYALNMWLKKLEK
jgi:hypothetical protein